MFPLYAVFGSPIGHSLSAQLHNAAFAAEGIEAHYVPVEVRPEGLVAALDAFRTLGGQGVNLTRPLKETVLPYLRGITAVAERAQAANTLVWRDGGWYGDNTDVQALVDALTQRIPRDARRALVVGAGGVALGTLVGLRPFDLEVTVAARSPGRLDQPVEPLTRLGENLPWDVVVNCTPLGQTGEPDWPVLPPLVPGRTVVVDWVYRPRRTALVQAAEAVGCPVIDGLELLIGQARHAWTLWFGHPGPDGPMREAVKAWR